MLCEVRDKSSFRAISPRVRYSYRYGKKDSRKNEGDMLSNTDLHRCYLFYTPILSIWLYNFIRSKKKNLISTYEILFTRVHNHTPRIYILYYLYNIYYSISWQGKYKYAYHLYTEENGIRQY